MTDRTTEGRPASVPPGARQAGDILARWAWVEPSVWTERMLTALEHGVKGGVWFSLIDKVYAEGNLRAAFARVKANRGGPGVDHQTIERFEADLDANLHRLSEHLRDGSYRPQTIRRVWIPKPGSRQRRPLGIPTVRDRVAQAALRHVLEPIFERTFAEHSYGFRPHRGCKDALRRVEGLLQAGHRYVVDADLRSYFDTIPHGRLLEMVRRQVADGRVLALVEAYLQQKVLETAAAWTPEQGSPQGAVISPLLSNIYLNPLDHLMADAGIEMVRYADDFVLLCRSESQARDALRRVQAWIDAAGLALHPDKTRIVDASQPGGFDFLGYHFECGRHWPSPKSIRKVRATIRSHTHRSNGHSLEAILSDVNRVLRGWFGYYQHSPRSTFTRLDGWVRMRLRSILRRRCSRRGRARGLDHHRWPNSFFADRGLFALTAAFDAARQSPPG